LRSSGLRAALVLLPALAAPAASAIAQEGPGSSVVDEVKIGVLKHDIGYFFPTRERGVDVIGEVLFKSPWFFKYIGSPRPAFGISGNTEGSTSYVYYDFMYSWMLTRSKAAPWRGLYAGFFLGGSVHDGNLNTLENGRKTLGTRALYHLGLLGGYQLTRRYSLELYYDHLSNANASQHNPGLNNLGLRVGYKF
jgi:lipid A 3-O-deacylase